MLSNRLGMQEQAKCLGHLQGQALACPVKILILPAPRVMRITSKGQVTIPQEIREQCGLLPHTQVRFVVEDGRVLIEKEPAQGSPREGNALGGLVAVPTAEERYLAAAERQLAETSWAIRRQARDPRTLRRLVSSQSCDRATG